MNTEAQDAEFAAFANEGDVEVGSTNLASQEVVEEKPKAKAPEPVEPEAGEGEEEIEETKDGEEVGEGEETPKPKSKKQTPSERIQELNRRLRDSERLRLADLDRFERDKNQGLQGGKSADTPVVEIGDAPSPSDTAKYPLGHLDDRYIEDKLEWLATKRAAERADAVLQRQQETERAQSAEAAQTALFEKVDQISGRGVALFDDYQEKVIEAGMKGDWPLTQTTFEAAAEAEHGERILYDLANDKAEAKRVAEMSPFAQLRYVDGKNAEYASKAKPRTKPGAGTPPETQTRGVGSKVAINPATDDLDEFEKLFHQKK